MKITNAYRLAALVAPLALPVAAQAQTYPFNNASYIPTASTAPTTCTTACDVAFSLNGVNTLSVRVTGTNSGYAAVLQVTNERTASPNWSTIYAVPVTTPAGSAVNSMSSNGFWNANVSGMVSARLHVTSITGTNVIVAMAGSGAPSGLTVLNPPAISGPLSIIDGVGGINAMGVGADNGVLAHLLAGTALVGKVGIDQTTPGSTNRVSALVTDGTNAITAKAASTGPATTDTALVVTQSPNSLDPCLNPNIAKLSAAINISAATTTKMVDVSGSKAIFVCNLTASLAGTTPSITFVSGTHTTNDCDTGAASLSGAILPTSGSMIHMGGSGTVMLTAGSKQLCGTTAGSGSSFQGILTYVQQ